jgi:predicted permease
MRGYWYELRQAWRSLAHTPWFTASAVLILGAGLGLVIFMFGAVQSFVLRDMPYPESSRLAYVYLTQASEPDNRYDLAPHDFVDIRAAQKSYVEFAGTYDGTVNLSGDQRPERYNGTFATANLLDALRVQPVLGRNFSANANEPGAPVEVILGHALWQNRFLGASDVIGRSVRVNGKDATIVGVMPPRFSFPFVSALYVNITIDLSRLQRGEGQPLQVVARLRNGVSHDEASAEFGALASNLAKQYPREGGYDGGRSVNYRERAVSRNTRSILGTMFISVVFVLLIACANVANLLLARAVARARETGIRNALGASRGRLIVQVVGEALAISGIAVLIGIALAQWGGHMTMTALANSEDPPPLWTTEMHVDSWTVAFAASLALLSALAAGLLPAWRVTRGSAARAMREGGHGTAGGLGRLGKVLITGEIALCMVLLVCAGLTVRSSIAMQNLDPGARVDNVLSGRLALFESSYPEPAQTTAFMQRLEADLSRLPGVTAATVSSSMPMTFANATVFAIDGRPAVDGRDRPWAWQISVTPSFFGMLEVPVLAGRGFTDADRVDAAPVVVVNRSAAEKYWPGDDPMGKRIRIGEITDGQPVWRTVVGVVGDVIHDDDAADHDGDDLAAVYLPFAQEPTRFVSFAVRTQGPPQALSDAVRAAVSALDSDQPVYFLRTLREWIDIASFDARLLATLFGVFGAFAVALASAGLYAVLAYAVSQRTREIGVRRALGASDRGIRRLVMAQGFTQTVIGLVLGTAIALLFARLLSNFLYGLQSFDPVTFIGAALLFLLVAALAAAIPTRRALHVAPMQALRYD